MWGSLKKVSVALLATRSPQPYSPATTEQVAHDSRSVYTLLREKGPIVREYSPTVRFTYVTPPSSPDADWSDADVIRSDADIAEKVAENDDDDTSQLFAEVAKKHGPEKPIAIYLPGLDGYGISAASFQFNDLARNFELWRMTVDTEDRTSFHQLVQTPVKFLEEIVGTSDRPVYLIGESFGGMLTSAVALQVLKRAERKEETDNDNDTTITTTTHPIKGIVLVNPATSFDASSWDVVAPILTTLGKLTQSPEPTRVGPFQIPSLYSVVGGLTLSAVIPSRQQYQRILDTFLNMESIRDGSRITETIQGFLEMFEITSEFLPPDLLEHRIKNWLMVGSSVLVESRLKQLDIPSLVVVGSEDNLLKSREEAKRLTKLLPKSQQLTVEDAGHFILDENVNLTEAILYSDLDPLGNVARENKYDPIVDWKIPSREDMNQTLSTTVKGLEDNFSPIWLSTDEAGKRSFGIGHVPREGPILFVSNHQLLGADLSLLVAKLYKNGIPVRGLAHPIIFQGGPPGSGSQLRKSRELGRVPGIEEPPMPENGAGNDFTNMQNFQEFGAVMVTPRNFYRLMQTGQNALLFPGGVREVFHGRNESYQLFWPEKVDFVRTAARFNATIVPVSAVGMADSFNFLLDSKELLDVPVLGERARDFANNVTAARFDAQNTDELFLPPIVAPGLPSRNYFVFGKPTHTHDIDPKNKEACKDAYLGIQKEMTLGFDDILAAREKDAFKDAVPRLAYERLTGQKAPTFDIKEIN